MAERRVKLHAWSYAELEDLFYDALLADARSVDYTAQQMRKMASTAAASLLRTGTSQTGRQP